MMTTMAALLGAFSVKCLPLPPYTTSVVNSTSIESGFILKVSWEDTNRKETIRSQHGRAYEGLPIFYELYFWLTGQTSLLRDRPYP